MYANLKAELIKNNITQKEVAEYLGLHENSIGNKVNTSSFSVEEAFLIKERFFPNCELKYLFAKTKESA